MVWFKSLFSVVFCLTFTACASAASSPSTFGLYTKYTTPKSERGSNCTLSGNSKGGGASRIDIKKDVGTPPPHLWLSQTQAGGDSPYVVEVAIVKSYEPGTLVPKEREVLKSVAYDSAFGAAAGSDQFNVSFEGGEYAIEVVGIPKDTGVCPQAQK